MPKVTKDVLVQVKLSRRERERWAGVAAREDLTLSEVVREAVRARLAGVVNVLDVERVRALARVDARTDVTTRVEDSR